MLLLTCQLKLSVTLMHSLVHLHEAAIADHQSQTQPIQPVGALVPLLYTCPISAEKCGIEYPFSTQKKGGIEYILLVHNIWSGIEYS